MDSQRQMYDFSVLRAFRHRDGMSIAQLSERSGVSPAVISKMERNQTQAELDTIYRVARVFGLDASDLVSLAERRSAQRQQATSHDNDGIRFDEIRYGNVRCLQGYAPKGTRTRRPQVHGDDIELCWVQSGRLRFRLPDEQFELSPGDAIQFDGVLEHSYEALEESTFLLVHLTKDKRF